MAKHAPDATITNELLAFVGVMPSAPAPSTLARELRKRILALAPSEGTRLFSITELVSHTGMSLGVIREAVQQLQSSGLIEVRQGARGGIFVRRVGEENLVQTLDALVQSNQVPRAAVAEARRELEGLCARIAAQRATPEHVAKLRASIEQMSTLVDMPERFAEENVNFHLLICQATENPVLIAVANALRELFYASSLHRDYTPGVLKEALRAHERIVEEIEAGNIERAAGVTVGHINALEERLQTPKPTPVRPARRSE